MMKTGNNHIISKLQKRWIFVAAAADALLALAITLIGVAVLNLFFVPPSGIYLVIYFLVLPLIAFQHNYWERKPAEIARYLNSRMPHFQESAQLLLKPAGSLTLVERLQVTRVEQAARHSKFPFFPDRQMARSAVILLLSVLLVAGLRLFPALLQKNQARTNKQAAGSSRKPAAEKKPAGISSLYLHLTPPAYTGRRPAGQSGFAIQTAEASEARWQITTSGPVRKLALVFNDRETVSLQANEAHTTWTVSKKLMGPGFYQVKVEDKLSEMYMIDLVKDQPPLVRILRPKQYTTIDFGEPQRVAVHVTASDDYGLGNAFMTATIASGSGEAVKFREQRLPLTGFYPGRQESSLQKTLDLQALGMKPGDELYYYVSATDNYRQETRSDIYTISLPDTAQLMEIEGLTNSITLKQEYFRSQRQIIIETEQLLKDRDTITATAFNNKSNNLGVDQKLLRLRYGKFLGEENENEIGGEHEHEGEHEERDQAVFGDAAALMRQYTHEHDNAEDATFFDPRLKAQLRETLSEMWKAELQLRLYKPQQALPFEYKALRLLKDLQQQSRSYVAKAAYKTTPLRPEKRLTADLSKIGQPAASQAKKPADEQDRIIRKAAGMLEAWKNQPLVATAADRNILQAAARQLGTRAVARPSLYLAPFEAMKKLLAAIGQPAAVSIKDIHTAEKGLQSLLQRTGKTPRPEDAGTPQQLSQQYFQNLHQTTRHP